MSTACAEALDLVLVVLEVLGGRMETVSRSIETWRQYQGLFPRRTTGIAYFGGVWMLQGMEPSLLASCDERWGPVVPVAGTR